MDFLIVFIPPSKIFTKEFWVVFHCFGAANFSQINWAKLIMKHSFCHQKRYLITNRMVEYEFILISLHTDFKNHSTWQLAFAQGNKNLNPIHFKDCKEKMYKSLYVPPKTPQTKVPQILIVNFLPLSLGIVMKTNNNEHHKGLHITLSKHF